MFNVVKPRTEEHFLHDQNCLKGATGGQSHSGAGLHNPHRRRGAGLQCGAAALHVRVETGGAGSSLMVARRAVAGLWLLILAVICTGSGAFQVLQAGRVPQSSLCSPPAAVCKSRPCIGSQASVYMSVPAGVDEDTSRHMAKKRLLKACEEFREAQLKLWASEALEEARLKKQGGKVTDKDRLGGLFGAESLGTVRLEVGELGNKTVALAEELSTLNPTPEPVAGWQNYSGVNPNACVLHGQWKKLFTTAADATFKPSARRGNATVLQDVDAQMGTFKNIIKFDGTANKVREFQVKIRGTPEDKDTISLDFRRITLLRRSKLPLLFGTITIFLPPRAVINAIAKWGSRGKAAAAPKAQLTLLYVDHELWVHKTGEGNIFVQQRVSDFNKSQAQLARDFDRAREETLEIQRIKNDFIARIEMAGRQATIRLKTMGEQGVAVSASSSSPPSSSPSSSPVLESSQTDRTDPLPEEIFLRASPMNLAKRNAIEANRKQWGIGYDPAKPERISPPNRPNQVRWMPHPKPGTRGDT